MHSMTERFDPENINKTVMKDLADQLELYLNLFENYIIIPQELEKCRGDEIKKAKVRVRKLIKNLRKGDKSVFKDKDEWDSIVSDF